VTVTSPETVPNAAFNFSLYKSLTTSLVSANDARENASPSRTFPKSNELWANRATAGRYTAAETLTVLDANGRSANPDPVLPDETSPTTKLPVLLPAVVVSPV
jgi:hypothetical protein